MKPPVGIDLGTTNCAVATVDAYGRGVIVPNRDGARFTPSVIHFGDSGIEVGDAARERLAFGDRRTLAQFKRLMGDRSPLITADGVDHEPTSLSALLLSRLKEDAEHRLACRIDEAVITVPAYFRERERTATIEAAHMAGLNVSRLINEPTAAAIAYGQSEARPNGHLLVYDLGGGTFDVTLLDLADDIRILGSEGDHQLGGKDFDAALYSLLAHRFEDEHGMEIASDFEAQIELLARAESAKHALSERQSVRVSMLAHGIRAAYEIAREAFEEASSDHLNRTIALVDKVLLDHGMQDSDIDAVLTVGGASRMPMVSRFLARRFGRAPVRGIDVDEAVALGAALEAHRLQQSRRLTVSDGGPGPGTAMRPVVDVTNHSLGMIAVTPDALAFVNSVIVPKSRSLPCREVRRFRHEFSPGPLEREVLEIFLTQGGSDMAAPDTVSYLGRYVVDGTELKATGPQEVDVAYGYNENGTVDVTATLVADGTNLALVARPLPADVPDRFLQPPQKIISGQSMTIYLVFDLSGSMDGEPLAEAKRSALAFLQHTDLDGARIGLISVADHARIKLKACEKPERIRRAIAAMAIGEVGISNSAHPFDALLSVLDDVEGPRLAIVLADGIWSDQAGAIDRARACHAAGIEIVALGFGEADSEFLEQIASLENAAIFTELSALQTTFSTIAQIIADSGGRLSSGQARAALRALRH